MGLETTFFVRLFLFVLQTGTFLCFECYCIFFWVLVSPWSKICNYNGLMMLWNEKGLLPQLRNFLKEFYGNYWFCSFLIHIYITICAFFLTNFFTLLSIPWNKKSKSTVSKSSLQPNLARMSTSMCQSDSLILKFFWENYSSPF